MANLKYDHNSSCNTAANAHGFTWKTSTTMFFYYNNYYYVELEEKQDVFFLFICLLVCLFVCLLVWSYPNIFLPTLLKNIFTNFLLNQVLFILLAAFRLYQKPSRIIQVIFQREKWLSSKREPLQVHVIRNYPCWGRYIFLLQCYKKHYKNIHWRPNNSSYKKYWKPIQRSQSKEQISADWKVHAWPCC